MSEENHIEVKQAILDHIREVFQEIEADAARSHEERYAMLEDVLENASDSSELRVAFEQWYADHADDLDLEYDLDEMWDQALHRMEEEMEVV